jgi:hypothetical protein
MNEPESSTVSELTLRENLKLNALKQIQNFAKVIKKALQNQ